MKFTRRGLFQLLGAATAALKTPAAPLTAAVVEIPSAGELSVWPIVFFKPGAVTKPGAFRMQPGMAIPAEDPSSVNVVKLLPNLAVTIQPYGLSFLVSRELLENAAVVSQPGVSRLAVILLEKLLQHVRPPLAMLRQVRLFALAFLPVRHGQH